MSKILRQLVVLNVYIYTSYFFLFQTTDLFEKLAREEPENIECKEQTPALDQVLKIVLNDSSSASLRIPKVAAKRPADFKLISGYTSELRIKIYC